MADRSIKVEVTAATTAFEAAMVRAQKSVTGFGQAASRSLDTAAQKIEGFGLAGQVAAGAAIAGFGLMVKSFADFDKQMSTVGAVTGETGAKLEELRGYAIQLGQDTQFSASQAAGAMGELAKAGVSTADILGGALSGSLSLAAAGGIELEQAATIASQAMNIFGLNGGQVGEVADALAGAANKSAAGVGDLGQAISQSGLVASQMGLSIQETTGALAAFADAGLVGSDAGTSLKTALMRLAAPTKEAKAIMDEYNISAYNADGSMKSLVEITASLEAGFGKMDVEQRNANASLIFGSDAIRAANVLYTEGADGIQQYVDATSDIGSAQRMASQLTDNLAGDIEQLGGSISTVLIQGGSGANDALRTLTQTATGLVNVIGSVPAPILAVGGAIGAVGGAAILAIPMIAKVKQGITELGISGGKARVALKGFGVALAASAIAGIGAAALSASDEIARLGQELKEAGEDSSKLTWDSTSLEEMAGKANQLRQAYDETNNSFLGFAKGIAQVGTTGLLDILSGDLDLTDANALADVLANPSTWRQGAAAVEGYRQTLTILEMELGVTAERAIELAEASGVKYTGSARQAADAIKTFANEQQIATEASLAAADAQGALADETNTLADDMKRLSEATSAYLDQLWGLKNAKGDVFAAARRLTEALDESNGSMNVTTENGYAAYQAYQGLISASAALAQEKYEEVDQTKGSVAAQEAYVRTLKKGITESLKAAGATDDQIKKVLSLDEVVNALPANVGIDVIANTSKASAELQTWYADMQRRFKDFKITLRTDGSLTKDSARFLGSEGKDGARANGGPVAASKRYLVGERGPEMFVPSSNGHIVDAATTRRLITALEGAGRFGATDNSRKLVIESVTVNASPGERVEQTLPMALKRMAFQGGM